MNWLVILDPIDGLISKTDTSLALIHEARRQGISVDSATIDKLYYDTDAKVIATADGEEVQQKNLGDYDAILMRKEPPYDLAFHYATHLLSLSETLVINSPSSLRDFNEKLITLPFVKYMPQTLVSSHRELITEFIGTHKHCVIKSLDTFQGKSVRELYAGSIETDTIINDFTRGGRYPVMVQEFLTKVFEGDKRVIMLGNKVLGAAMRRPKSGFHANFANSDALPAKLTMKEQEIVEIIGPWMVKQGIYFSGLDFIGEQLTEINITCPTGIIQISELDNTNLAKQIIDFFKQLVRVME